MLIAQDLFCFARLNVTSLVHTRADKVVAIQDPITQWHFDRIKKYKCLPKYTVFENESQ